MIDTYPVKWDSPDVQELLEVLQQSIYNQKDIERVVEDAGLPPYLVRWDTAAVHTWRSAYDVAASQGLVSALLNEAVQLKPAIKPRVDELVTASGHIIAADLVSSDATAVATFNNFSPDGREERVIDRGRPTFVDVAFLSLAVDKARSVCRLSTRFSQGEGSGTGFRVGPKHILTNHHVLFDTERNDQRIDSAEAWFNYEVDERGLLKDWVRIECDPASIVTDKADDWALIRTVDPIPDDFPPLPLVGAREPRVDDRVCIIQHPNGLAKKIAFQHNLVREVTPEVLQYWTDTDAGSSGSPIFDHSWNVVGLHHYSLAAPESERTDWRNQGRRISRVVERMKELGVYPGGA